MSLLLVASLSLPAAAKADQLEAAARDLSLALADAADCQHDDQLRVGIFPFDETRLPLPPENAFALYERFLARLIESAPQCIRYVDGRGAFVTLEYLGKAGTLRETGQEHRAQIQENLEDVAYTITGTILDGADGLRAVFGLTDFDRSTAIARSAFPVPDRYTSTACGAGAVPLSTALPRLADNLVDRAGDLRRITLLGGYLAETDAQTSFSRYVEQELSGALSKAAEDVLTDRTLAIVSLRDQRRTRLRSISTRGASLTPREFEDAAVETVTLPADAPGSYRLRFRYWPCDGDAAARLSVSLQGTEGRRISELTNVGLGNLPSGLELRPPRPTTQADWGPDGAFTFQMSSQRGPNPAFRAGEKLEVLFRTGRDAWLYCFYTDAEGETVQMLPNPFQIGQEAANFYEGDKLHLFPDPERLPRPDPFDIVINDDTLGTEVFRCLATPRDVRAELPAPLRGTSLDPIPLRYTTRLREIFEDIQGAALTEARMTVTVLQ